MSKYSLILITIPVLDKPIIVCIKHELVYIFDQSRTTPPRVIQNQTDQDKKANQASDKEEKKERKQEAKQAVNDCENGTL